MEQRPLTSQKRKRNYGVDILKMISMFMVTILHTIGYGGFLDPKKRILNTYVSYLMEIGAYCAVDIFGMVSGYLIINSKKVNLFKFVPLWLTVFFYTFSITMLFKFVPPLAKYKKIGLNEILTAFFPIYNKSYWYFTSYFGLYMFIPYINELLHSIGKRRHKHLIIIIISFLSVIPIIVIGKKNDNFTINNGYSQWWLGCLYVIGAYFKLYPVKINKLLLLVVYVISILIVWAAFFFQSHFYLLQYESIFILLSGISLFLLFIQVDVKSKFIQKILELGSSVSFCVYIIHFNPILYPIYLRGKLASLINDPTILLVLKTLLTASAIYITCSVIDLFRYYLFKFLNVNKLPGILENYYKKIVKDDDDDTNKKDSEVKDTDYRKINNEDTESSENTYQELSVEVIPPSTNDNTMRSNQQLNSESLSDLYDNESKFLIKTESK